MDTRSVSFRGVGEAFCLYDEPEKKPAIFWIAGSHGLQRFVCSERSDHVLEGLQGADLDDPAGGLGLEHLLFLREGVDALASLHRLLV